MPTLNGRNYSLQKTGIEDLERLQEVRRSLITREGKDRLQERAKIRRQSEDKPLSRPLVSSKDTTPIDPGTQYRVLQYIPDSDKWLVESVSNPSTRFLAYSIKSGGISLGSIVRGYYPVAIEPQPQGRRFEPVENETIKKEKDLTITITIGYTGKVN